MDGEMGRAITPSPFHLGSGVRNPERAISMNASALRTTNSAFILQTEVGGVLGESRGGFAAKCIRAFDGGQDVQVRRVLGGEVRRL
jgi:hypothetical protein